MDEDTERVFASTTFVWKHVKIQAPPRPQGTARAKRAHLTAAPAGPASAARQARKPFTVQIRYRGGSEAWWEITYAGKPYRFRGDLFFHDVMRHVLQLEDL
jgi:hypothetical protein